MRKYGIVFLAEYFDIDSQNLKQSFWTIAIWGLLMYLNIHYLQEAFFGILPTPDKLCLFFLKEIPKIFEIKQTKKKS